MQSELNPDARRLLDELVASGRYASADAALAQALQLLAERDHLQQERVEQLQREIAEGLRNQAHRAARVYHVPRRFGLGALLVVTAFFCVLFGVLRLFLTPPPVMAYIGLQVITAAVMQMIIRKSPRAASALAGAVLLPVTVVCYVILYHHEWSVIAATPCLAVAGVPLGYLAGALIAGVFLVMEMADDWIARRTDRATETESPDPLAEETEAEPEADGNAEKPM